MAYSQVVAIGDGSTTQFAVNFALDFIREEDIKCRVGTETDGSGDPVYRPITFLSTNLIQVGGAAPGVGVKVVFERTVSKDDLLVDYQNGDQMDEENLMIAQKQALMAVHEALDGRVELTRDLNANGFTVTNLRAPTAPSDAVTKEYIDTAPDWTLAEALAILADTTAVKEDAEAALAAFRDTYYGSLSADPATAPSGAPVQAGHIYYNTVANELRYYSSGIWKAVGSGGSSSSPTAPQGRITLTSGVAVMQSSVAAAPRVYYTNAIGKYVPIYDGVRFNMTAFAEVFQDLTDATKSPAAAVANAIYDLFGWLDGSTFRVTRGPAWTNDTTRALALVTVDGFPLNASAITNGPAAQRGTWLGTIGTNASGTVDWILGTLAVGGGAAVLGIHNAYNEVPVCVQIKDVNSWTYTFASAAAWRAADNSNTFRCTFVRGKPGQAISADYNSISQASATSVSALIGIGLDTTTVNSGTSAGNFGWTNPVPLNAKWAGLISEGATGVGIGRHYISAIEKVLNAGNSQYFGGDYSALTVSLMA